MVLTTIIDVMSAVFYCEPVFIQTLYSSLFVYLQTVQKRGAAVIAARKLSSAMSAAKAIGDHLRDWHFGTQDVSSLFWNNNVT